MKAISTQVLQTDRLILRRFVESDAATMYQNWASRPENLTYVTWDAHASLETTQLSISSWVQSYQKPDFYKWAICFKEQPNHVIGDISVVELEGDSCEVGYILSLDYWGRGIMTEALAVVLDFLLEQVGFKTVTACFASLNPASGCVMEKAGMTYLETIPRAIQRKGYVADKVYYHITKNFK